ncbi:hypothetical protein DLH72_03825 [Candidatus Gracilibacteria bacterium]|nr:MAG: hypothetical protein DLH72_03825 [Candidatus Gracilibacteria bacterium]
MIIYNIKKAFTVVELIVVIFIVGILATIGFISFSGYTQDASDNSRIQDLKTISNLLEYEISMGKDLPQPDGDLITETYEIGGQTYTFKTGTFGQSKNDTFRGKLSSLPLDPSGAEYKYSLSDDGRYYVLTAKMENQQEHKISNLNDGGTGLLTLNPKKPEQGGTATGSNNQGNPSDPGTGPDTIPPKFGIQNGHVINVVYGGYADMTQIKATDNRPGTINYSYNPTTINTSGDPRGYDAQATIKAVDQAGNESSVNVIFRISRKYTFPTFNKTDFSIIELNKGQAVNHSLITATDEVDGNLTVTRSGDVNVNTPGEYPVSYSAKNSGNVTGQITIKYVVKGGATGSNLGVEDGDKLSFVELTNEIIITGLKPGVTVTDLDIPTTINGKPVTEINANAFKQKGLKTVSGPSILRIGESAFEGNILLISINLPSVTNIGNNAFSHNQLTNINLPQVTTIGDAAFRNNRLTSINLPLVTDIGNSAFYSNGLTSINFPQVTSIGGSAFSDNKLTSISIPLVTTIESYTFQSNQLTSINFPQVTSIGNYAFQSNQLTSINFPQVTSIGNNAFQSNKLTSINFPQVTTIDDQAFSSNQLTSINLPSVTTIGYLVFQNNQLTSIDLPSVTTIKNQAFKNNNFTTVNLPASLTSLGNKAFIGNGVFIINNPSSLTENQIKGAFNYNAVRQYNGECRKNGNPC